MQKIAFLLKLRRKSMYLYIPLYVLSRMIKKTQGRIVIRSRAIRLKDCLVRSTPI